MRIEIRKVSDIFVKVEVEDGNTTLDLGLLNEEEAKELADQFQEAADKLRGE